MFGRKFHLNLNTGKVGACHAKKNCPFGDMDADHWPTRELAQKSYDDFMREFALSAAIQKKKKLESRAQSKPVGNLTGKVIESNGRFSVSVDAWDDGNLVKMDFAPNISREDAEALIEADPKGNFQNGDCSELANYLWNRHPDVVDFCYVTTKSEPAGSEGIHQLVRLKNGKYVDSMGIWDGDAIVKAWEATGAQDVKLEVYPESDPSNPTLPDPNWRVDFDQKRILGVLDGMIQKSMGQYSGIVPRGL